MFMDKEKAIGVFDSGFGGIDILRHIVKDLPEYNFIYLGDTARTPYGTRTRKTIHKFTEEGVEFLLGKNCPLVVLACNTASSQALPLFSQRLKRKTLGIIKPASRAAAKKNPDRVGVIGTEATIRSNVFKKNIKKIDSSIKVYQNPAPLLVPIVEEGEEQSEIARLAVIKYLGPLLEKRIEALVLGCTHFGILEKTIKETTGPGVDIIKEGPVIARKLKRYLGEKPEIEKTLSKNGRVYFYSTDLTDKFIRLGSKFFGKKIKAQSVNL